MEKNPFSEKRIRALYSEKTERWYFCAIDVCAALTGKERAAARSYWKSHRHILKKRANELVENFDQLKMKSRDGSLRYTQVLDIAQILYLVQIIPGKNAEPFKIWLAKTAATGEAAAALIKLGEENFKSTLTEVQKDESTPVRLKSTKIRKIPLE